MSFSPTYLGPFWGDDLFGVQTKSVQPTIVLFHKQFEEFAFYFLNSDISHGPAEQVA